MATNILKVYTYKDGVMSPFPNNTEQIEIGEWKYNATRMGGAPTITAKIMHKRCLDDYWTGDECVEFRGEKYFIKDTPSSSKDNTDERYTHDIVFKSERSILDGILYVDSVSGEDKDDRYLSENTNVVFMGTISEFVGRLNAVLKKSKLGGIKDGEGYYVVIDDGITSEAKLVNFDEKHFSEVLQEIFNIYEIPYYFVGKVIHVGYASNNILEAFEYGIDNELLSIQKQNSNNGYTNRMTGVGSSENLPHFYPNSSSQGATFAEYSQDGKKYDNYVTVDNPSTFGSSMPIVEDGVEASAENSIIHVPQSSVPIITDCVNNGFVLSVLNSSTNSDSLPVLDCLTAAAQATDIFTPAATIPIDYVNITEVRDTNQHFEKKNIIQYILPQKNKFISAESTVYYKNTNSNIRKICLQFCAQKSGNTRITTKLSFNQSLQWSNVESENKSSYLTTPTLDSASIEYLQSFSNFGEKIVAPTCAPVYIDDEFEFVNTKGRIYPVKDFIVDCFNLQAGITYRIVLTIRQTLIDRTNPDTPEGGNYDALMTYWGMTSSATPSYWQYNGKQVLLSSFGLSIDKSKVTAKGGDMITRRYVPGALDNIPNSSVLMPSIYRQSNGEERFYNAKNDGYTTNEAHLYIADADGNRYNFENVYNINNPHEAKRTFEDIKPTIKEMVNAEGKRMDMFLDIAFDNGDNDNFAVTEGESEAPYDHSYFYVKLARTSGRDNEYGFNLFDQAVDDGSEMTVNMTSGSCGACVFTIQVQKDTNKNMVQVDGNGNLLRDNLGRVINNGTPQPQQNDTRNNEVWICLKKEDSTYGIIMPNVEGGYRPKVDINGENGDTFVYTNIEMPMAYILDAEDRLSKAIVKEMWVNNSEKFNFSISFSRIFFAENPDMKQLIDENTSLPIKYNGKTNQLYVSSYTYSVKNDEILPEIKVDLVEEISTYQNAIQKAMSDVSVNITNAIANYDVVTAANPYFLRKDIADIAHNSITYEQIQTFLKQAVLKDGWRTSYFQSGLIGEGAMIDKDGNLEVESLFSRGFISTPEFRFNRIGVTEGEQWCTNGYGIIESVEVVDEIHGRIKLRLEDNEYASIAKWDICRGIYNDVVNMYGDLPALEDDSVLYADEKTDADKDLSRSFGFATKTGFFTSYFFVKEIITYNAGECIFEYELRNESTPHPCAFMKFAQYGSFENDSKRTSSSYATSIGHYYEMVLDGVQTWNIQPENVVYRIGWLGDMEVKQKDGTYKKLQGYGMYCQDNIYFGNAVIQLDPKTLSDLKRELAVYNVSFAEHVDVVTVDERGYIIGGLYTLNENGGKQYRISSAITARRNNDILLFEGVGTDASEGCFKVSAQGVGCTCKIEDSTLYITGIDNTRNDMGNGEDDAEFDYDAMRNLVSCSVDLVFDFEGRGTTIKSFPVTILHDNTAAAFVVDTDNEMTSIPVSFEGVVESDLQVQFNISAYWGTEDVTAGCNVLLNTILPDGFSVIMSTSPIIKISAGCSPEQNTELSFIVSHPLYGNRVVTVTIIAIRANKSGEDAVLYELMPSMSSVLVDSDADGNLIPETVNVKCGYLKRVGNKDAEIVEGKDFTGGNIDKYRIYVRVHYRETQEWFPYYRAYQPTGTSVSASTVDMIEFSLGVGSTSSSLTLDEIIDVENIPIIINGKDGKDGEDGQDGKDGKDGKDGESPLMLDLDNEMDSFPATSEGLLTSNYSTTIQTRLFLGISSITDYTISLNRSTIGDFRILANSTNKSFTISASKGGKMPSDSEKIVVTAEYNGMVRTATFTLLCIRAGEDGEGAAAILQLLPSISEFSFDRAEDGITPIPAQRSLYCGYTKNVSGEITSYGGRTEEEVYRIDGKYNIFFRYINSDGTTGNWGWLKDKQDFCIVLEGTTSYIGVELALSSSQSYTLVDDTNIIDRETIPVIRTGRKGDDGENGEDGLSIIVTPQDVVFDYGVFGMQTIYVDLYVGGERIPYGTDSSGFFSSPLTEQIEGLPLVWTFETTADKRFLYKLYYSATDEIHATLPITITYKNKKYYSNINVNTLSSGISYTENLLTNTEQRRTVTNTTEGDHYLFYQDMLVDMKKGQTYTISGKTNGVFSDSHADNGVANRVVLWLKPVDGSFTEIKVSGTDMKSDGSTGHTFVWGEKDCKCYIRFNTYSTGDWWIEKLKIEEGKNIKTCWTPANADLRGARGATIRGPQQWNDVENGYVFYSGADGEAFIDVVIYDDDYYYCQNTHIKSTSSNPSTSSGFWRLGSKFEMIATNLLLAEKAVIKNLGADFIEMKDSNGNILFQVKDGNVIANTGTFKNISCQDSTFSGTLNGVSGSFVKLRNVNATSDGAGSLIFSGDHLEINGDIMHQGAIGSGGASRPGIFRTQHVWVRGSFATVARNTMLVRPGNVMDFIFGSQAVTNVPIPVINGYYCLLGYYTQIDLGEFNAPPVDVIVFQPTTTTPFPPYCIIPQTTQRILLVNASNVYTVSFYQNGNIVNLKPGEMREIINLRTLSNPVVSESKPGAGIFMGASYQNSWT